MHYNKQRIDLIKSGLNNKTSFDCTPPTARTSDTEAIKHGVTALLFETNKEEKRNTVEQYETTDIRKYSGTTTSCASSTDSGVNVSDNDEAPPSSPTSSNLHPSLLSSSEITTSVNQPCYKQFHKRNKNTNQDNNIENNYNNKNIISGDNDVDHDENDDKFKVVDVDGSNGGINTRYQSNKNNIESKNVIHISQQGNVTKSTSTTATAINDKPPLRYNDFIKHSQRPPSTSSSLSMSSTTNSYNDHPSSNMHHCGRSPVVSIRSISSSIIISDSDSDLNSDTEGIHENYVIKKLGTQVTYSSKDPNIPNINSGHTVLNQKVIVNDDQVPLPELAALAAIGDRIGAAQALGPVPSNSTVAQRPQIGSIALSNSSDVTFGDKHFYEGPVTIQQFLIDGRDQWKETNEKDNPTFVNENIDTSTKNAKDINSEESSKLYEYVLKRKKFIIPVALALIALLIVAAIFGSKTLNDSKNSDDDELCDGNSTLCLIERDIWRAHPQKNGLENQALPLHRVVISHTASEACESIKICSYRVRVIQEFHMNSLGWSDIGYNFLISSDGRVYVGRGWDIVGAHTKGYNFDSVGISFIGTYMSIPPSEAQLNACLLLLENGVHLKKLVPDYRLYGARQLGATESPGEMLYKRIKKWPHWSANISPT